MITKGSTVHWNNQKGGFDLQVPLIVERIRCDGVVDLDEERTVREEVEKVHERLALRLKLVDHNLLMVLPRGIDITSMVNKKLIESLNDE